MCCDIGIVVPSWCADCVIDELRNDNETCVIINDRSKAQLVDRGMVLLMDVDHPRCRQ